MWETTALMSWSLYLASRVTAYLGVMAWGEPPRGGGGRFAAMSVTIEVVINGQTRTVTAGTSVAGLIRELGLADRPVAVERNREVVPRARHADTLLSAGDRLEVVTFVGGG
jgi:sulfur carrier protein